MSADAFELAAIISRAGVEEARRLAALERGDRAVAADATCELARLWSRYVDLARDAGLEAVHRPPP